MTADEQTILRIYLLRISAISSPADFEEWHRVSTDTKKGKAATVALLELARAYDLGLRDAKLQAEAWVEGIESYLQPDYRKADCGANSRICFPGSNWFPLAVSPCRTGGPQALARFNLILTPVIESRGTGVSGLLRCPGQQTRRILGASLLFCGGRCPKPPPGSYHSRRSEKYRLKLVDRSVLSMWAQAGALASVNPRYAMPRLGGPK